MPHCTPGSVKMRAIIPVLLLLLFGCNSDNSGYTPEFQEYINITLAQDRKNKELELFYLREIRAAEENGDSEAFRFYLSEYMAVPRMDIPDWMKEEPGYFVGGEKVKY